MLVGGLLATASSANASILASSRINSAMGRDRLVTPDLNEIHPRFGTPYRSIAVTGGLILLFIVVADVQTLSTPGSILDLIIYGLLDLALIVFRRRRSPTTAPPIGSRCIRRRRSSGRWRPSD
jgi:amino acid transporter